MWLLFIIVRVLLQPYVVDATQCGSCPTSSVHPPSPRIILLGQTGAGKSTLGNRLLGNMPGECAVLNEFTMIKNKTFPTGHEFVSKTNMTEWVAAHWLSKSRSSCFTLIDTPGIGDVQGRDCEHAVEIANSVRELDRIDMFLIVFKSTDNRFSTHLQEQLKLYEQMFGKLFWEKVVIEVSFWQHSEVDVKRRRRKKTNEKKFAQGLNHEITNLFNLERDLPFVFVDPMYNEYPEYEDDMPEAGETEMFDNMTSKLWNLANRPNPFTCNGLCNAPGFLNGIPVLPSSEISPATVREGGKLVIQFSIWFGNCDAPGTRSYDILRNGDSIYHMTDEQENKDGLKSKPKEETKGRNFPAGLQILDECSVQISGSVNLCDHGASKYKKVTLIFNPMGSDSFGNYSVSNVKGISEDMVVIETIDGIWREWGEWGTCSRTCIPEDGVPGTQERRRECTEPVNGGHDCPGEGSESRPCNFKQCDCTPGEWSPWSPCTLTCGGGVSTRDRDCKGGLDIIDLSRIERKDCNILSCPVSAEWSEWTQWNCDAGCYKPNRQAETTQTRSRSCVEGFGEGGVGLHPTDTCEKFKFEYWKDESNQDQTHTSDPLGVLRSCLNLRTDFLIANPNRSLNDAPPCEDLQHTWWQTHKNELNLDSSYWENMGMEESTYCQSITECPALIMITTTVCGATYSGTDDSVYLKFRNRRGEECSTDWLNTSGNDWSTGATQHWAQDDHISSCGRNWRSGLGTANDQVSFKVAMTSNKWYGVGIFAYDALRLCRVTATFGSGSGLRYQWNGDFEAEGAFSNWVHMSKISG